MLNVAWTSLREKLAYKAQRDGARLPADRGRE
jgi:hypothetical protein